jgi:hypothetical protein
LTFLDTGNGGINDPARSGDLCGPDLHSLANRNLRAVGPLGRQIGILAAAGDHGLLLVFGSTSRDGFAAEWNTCSVETNIRVPVGPSPVFKFRA